MAFALTRRHRCSNNLLERASRYYGLEKPHIALSKRLAFEQRDIRSRRSALLIIQRLLEEWPKEFINFSNSNKLECGVWVREHELMPFWLWSVSHLNLRRRSYTPSEQEITSILDYINKSGRKPSSNELCKYLNSCVVPSIMRQRGLTKSAI